MNTLDVETVDGRLSPFPPSDQCPGFIRRSARWIYRGWVARGAATGEAIGGVVCGAVVNRGRIVADGGPLVFTNGAGFSSVLTNWGVMCETNGGRLVFAGSEVNYARPVIVSAGAFKGGWLVAFRSVGGLTNCLEATDGWVGPTWSEARRWVGTGGDLVFIDSFPPAQRFYRVRVESRP
jgi:hypothetical protein